ncbi:MAG: hypothetical protein EON61_09790 [Alphaproteobacteria bacterium]|nr:MAG: hypothetical protein EON61_09790 [Alphaproteobacteria bacterium]
MSLAKFRFDRVAAIAAAAILFACAYIAFVNRFGFVIPMLPEGMFWDSAVFAAAGEQVSQGINPYFEPVIDFPFTLPFISAPQVAAGLAGLSSILGPALFPLLALCHIAALLITPLLLTRLFLGKSWQEALLGYGLVACFLAAAGVTAIVAGNFGMFLYLAIFAAMIPGLRDRKWIWFHIAVAVAVQIKPPYGLLWIIPVLANGWSWKQFQHAAIAAAASTIPYAAAFVIDRPFFDDWLGSLARQVGFGDHGDAPYGAVINLDPGLQNGPVPMLVHVAVCLPLLIFLMLDRTRGMRKVAALVAFAILANPRLKEYDLAFATIPVAGLYLSLLLKDVQATTGFNYVRNRAIGIALLVALSVFMLRADRIPLIGPFMYSIVIIGAILTLAYRPRSDAAKTPASA